MKVAKRLAVLDLADEEGGRAGAMTVVGWVRRGIEAGLLLPNTKFALLTHLKRGPDGIEASPDQLLVIEISSSSRLPVSKVPIN